MPMIPEAIVAMLACARIGAPHTVVFGGFSADALASRIDDCQAKVVITSDGGYRRGSAVRAQAGGRRGPDQDGPGGEGARRPAHRPGPAARTAGTTRWTCGGTTSSTPRRPSTRPRRSTPSTRSTSCTPPGPPASRRASCTRPAATSPVRRTPTTRCSTSSPTPTSTGAPPTSAGSPATATSSTGRWPTASPRCSTKARPTAPSAGRWWQIVEQYGVTIFYTAPTAIRSFMKQGNEIPDQLRHVEPADPRLGR